MYKRALFVIALVAACGDDDPARHLDGGVTIDSSTPLVDAPWEPVTLTIKLNGAAQPNIVVHFQNADSSLVATEMTDGSGTVSHVMAPGGYVSAIAPFAIPSGGPPTTNVYTFAGVKPGDQLQLTEANAGSISMNITLPVQGDTDTVKYVVGNSCSRNPTTFFSSGSGFQPAGSISFNASCTTADILAVSFDDNNNALGFIYVPDVTVTANGSLAYANKSYATPTNRTYTYNTATGLSPVQISQTIGNASGAMIRIGHPTTGTPNTATVPLPTFANAVGITESAFVSIAQSQHILLDWGPLATTPFTTDIGARKLVDVSNPTYDYATHTLSWTEGTGVAPDANHVGIFVNRTLASNNNFGVDWQMIAAHTGASAKFPTLPVGTVDYNADADDRVDPTYLTLVKVPPADYDAIRTNGFILAAMFDNEDFSDFPTTTSTGAAAIVYWAEQLTVARTTERLKALRHRTRR
jgi:hypothetical protein